MREVKFILRDVLYNFMLHDNDYHHTTPPSLIKEIVEYIDNEIGKNIENKV